MNKHDIEELQAFLQGEYIEESTLFPHGPSEIISTWLGSNTPKEYIEYIESTVKSTSTTCSEFCIDNTYMKLYTARGLIERYGLYYKSGLEMKIQKPKSFCIGITNHNEDVMMDRNKNSSIYIKNKSQIIAHNFKEVLDCRKKSWEMIKNNRIKDLKSKLNKLEKDKGVLPEDYKLKLISGETKNIHEFFYDLEEFVLKNSENNIDGFYQVGDWERNDLWLGLRISDNKFGYSNDKYKTFTSTSKTINRLSDYIDWNEIDEAYIDKTIERFDTFMEEFNMTHGDDNYER